MKKYIQLSIYFILLFILFFGFQVHGISTRYIATAVLFIECLFVRRYRYRCLMFIQTSAVRYLRSIIVYNIITILWTYILWVADISFFVGTFRLVIIAFDMIMLWAILPEQYRPYHLHLIVGVFILQSFIIFAAFLNPTVLDIVRGFQFEGIIDTADRYLNNGIFRGLALSGDQFFGLSASFGLISIIVVKLYLDTSQSLWIVLYLILFAANMFVGRTGFVGFAFAFCYLLISDTKGKLKLIVRVVLFIILALFCIYVFLPPAIKDILDESVFAFAFQLFYNYENSGSFSTSSTDTLLDMWEIDISFLTALIGDGRFVNADGSYYGHVDVGFLRQLLYGGILYLVYSILVTFKILTNYSRRVPFKLFKLEYVIFIYLLATHAKGLSFMYCPEMMMIVLFYYYHQNYERLKSIR